MRKWIVTLASILVLLVPAAAQNNPYELDDDCYALFRKAESLVGKVGSEKEFDEVTTELLSTAVAKGDTKAQTLYYVERLKQATHPAKGKEDDAKVVSAHEMLKDVARKLGHIQYYYYSYELVQNYYYNHNQQQKALDLILEMQNIAIDNDEPYGEWMSYRFLVSLYLAQSDYISAKRHIKRGIELYNASDDSLVLRQSICRSYIDLADTYPVGSDSMRINVDKGFANSKQHLDTLRCYYYYSVLNALDNNISAYRQYRDYCMKDDMIHTITKPYKEIFKVIDDILDGSATIDSEKADLNAINRIREEKFVANIAEKHEKQDIAFYLEKRIVVQIERQLAKSNSIRLVEFDARFGKRFLEAEVAEKERDIDEFRVKIGRISGIVMILIAVILVGALIVTIFEIRALVRRKKRDEAQIADLMAANEKVRLADAAKTRFVQNMSHEVRTPLNAIVGFSQLLSLPDGTFPPEEKEEFSSHIINNTEMLTVLLDDILNASAMDSGEYRIVIKEGEKNFMCNAAISSSEHRLQPGVTMTYEPEDPEPFTFRTDPRRVQQIIINLLTNACKQTAKGKIVLSSSIHECPGFVTFTVTDTGPGVPPDKAEHIFDRFTKLNDFVQGTGLGLSICRDIADRMGARVYLDTTYTEGGARFKFEVPVVPPQDLDKPENN